MYWVSAAPGPVLGEETRQKQAGQERERMEQGLGSVQKPQRKQLCTGSSGRASCSSLSLRELEADTRSPHACHRPPQQQRHCGAQRGEWGSGSERLGERLASPACSLRDLGQTASPPETSVFPSVKGDNSMAPLHCCRLGPRLSAQQAGHTGEPGWEGARGREGGVTLGSHLS